MRRGSGRSDPGLTAKPKASCEALFHSVVVAWSERGFTAERDVEDQNCKSGTANLYNMLMDRSVHWLWAADRRGRRTRWTWGLGRDGAGAECFFFSRVLPLRLLPETVLFMHVFFVAKRSALTQRTRTLGHYHTEQQADAPPVIICMSTSRHSLSAQQTAAAPRERAFQGR